MPYASFGRGPGYMAAAGLVAVIALILGILMLADHRSSRGVIFIVAAVLAVIVAAFARPRRG
jgi:glucose uptake protein GlcU